MKTLLPRLKDFAADLSLANLCFLKVWVMVLYNDETTLWYYCSGNPIPIYLATIANILLLALLFYALRAIELKYPSPFILRIRLAFTFLATGLAINGFRTALNSSCLLPKVPIIAGILIFLIACFFTVKYQCTASRYLRFTSLVFLPLFFIIVIQATIESVNWEPPPSRTASIASGFKLRPHGDGTNPHVIWIIFDEMDERIAFLERPPTLKLPELDRFRLQSLSADNALPPSGTTKISMPALISGHIFDKATPASANDLILKFAGQGNEARWGSLPSIFSKLGKDGYTSQVVGCYHPYGRVFMNDLINVHSYPFYILADPRNRKMMGNMLNAFVFLFQVNIIRPQAVAYAASMFNEFHRYAKDAIIEPVTLTLLHYPIPHEPYFYNRSSGDFLGYFLPQTQDHYLDNLALADRTFGELRKNLESVGMWDTSAIIVSTDHWWRFSKHYDGKTDHRIPFMVKLAGQNAPIIFSKPFNTVLTSDMIMSIVNGEISTHIELSSWLDKNGKNTQPIVPEGIDNLEMF